MATMNKQWLLASRPSGEATTANFRFVETALPALQDGQVLVRHHFLSLDPYMRGRMSDAKSYAQPQPLDAVMGGGTVGLSAAAQFYFGKQIKDLTLAEAAMLAGLFKAPTKYAPHNNLPAARARASSRILRCSWRRPSNTP